MGRGQTSGSSPDTAGPPPRSRVAEEGEVSDLSFNVNVSIRYHQKRRGWYERLHRISVGTALITSSGAFAALLAGVENAPAYTKWIAFSVVVITGVDWVTGFSEKARLHDQLYRRFSELAADIVGKEAPLRAQLRKWYREVYLIESDEPSQLRILTRICYNEEVQARNDGRCYPVPLYQRWLAHIFSFPAGPRPPTPPHASSR